MGMTSIQTDDKTKKAFLIENVVNKVYRLTQDVSKCEKILEMKKK